MKEHEETLITLAVIGGLIAIGKVLISDVKITVRLFLGRTILGSGLSLVAGTALVHFPQLSPLAVCGLGALLGIAGYQVFEIWIRRRLNVTGEKSSDTQ